MNEALHINVKGVVQGVGFRPFVYRLAQLHLIKGWVLNDNEGVLIHAEGESANLNDFIEELHMHPPAAARIKELMLDEVPLEDYTDFTIRSSNKIKAEETTLISPDLGICEDCLSELFDKSDRRFRYPFTNCTNCGPRFTLMHDLPYDRPTTSMAPFLLCDKCHAEYTDPKDRRFHAQPNACFECGPHLFAALPAAHQATVLQEARDCFDVLRETYSTNIPSVIPFKTQSELVWGCTRSASDAIIAAACTVLAAGGIVALKGLGGFHLVCDAADDQAIARLRARKRRSRKPFAVMATDLVAIDASCEIDDEERALLASPARPIVLLKKRSNKTIASGVADGVAEFGIMLAQTPLQALLIHDYYAKTGSRFLVMTSGNLHDDPIIIDDAQALEDFSGIADLILGNNRPIVTRYDDSIYRILHFGDSSAIQCIRRARGQAPLPLSLTQPREADASLFDNLPTILAVGSEQKNTITYIHKGKAYISQHLGDLESPASLDFFHETRDVFEHIFDLSPTMLACDLHPEYLSTKWARRTARDKNLKLGEVQHHYAHLSAVLAEQGIDGACLGFVFDGTGYGADGRLWGGEVLLANRFDYERFANCSYMPMPGGTSAILHPDQMAYGILYAYDLLDSPLAAAFIERIGDKAQLWQSMIDNDINTFFTSSIGRFLDGLSALMGICTEVTYEGEPAIALDALQYDPSYQNAETEEEITFQASRYRVALVQNTATKESTAHDTSVIQLDMFHIVKSVLEDLKADVAPPLISMRIHRALMLMMIDVAELARRIYDINTIALTGGCFMNRNLCETAVVALQDRGFKVALNGELPPNDGCISYGQAAHIAARMNKSS